jgi:uncharacterized Zn finger protein
MNQTDLEAFTSAIQSTWDQLPSAKATRYIGKFFDRSRIGKRITAKVHGNYGVYTVSIGAKKAALKSACSCYIGKGGICHHCDALAFTFLDDPESFKPIKEKALNRVRTVDDLESYLKGKTLDSLLQELKAKGITQKEFAESIGMNPRHLSSIKSSELRNRYYNELVATK